MKKYTLISKLFFSMIIILFFAHESMADGFYKEDYVVLPQEVQHALDEKHDKKLEQRIMKLYHDKQQAQKQIDMESIRLYAPHEKTEAEIQEVAVLQAQKKKEDEYRIAKDEANYQRNLQMLKQRIEYANQLEQQQRMHR